MLIANPIYDIVFKYLMEDSRVAKLLLAAITNLDIIELDFLPQELASNIEDKNLGDAKSYKSSIVEALGFSIYRLDFAAKVRESSGEEKVIIIEIQKSKLSNDIMRFRKYLGKQFMNPNLFKWVNHETRPYKKGLPILSIYFLGEEIYAYKDTPIILIDNYVTDRYTHTILDQNNDFVTSLYHTGIIVNIPALSKRRRDELEILLSIFDQDNRTASHHILNINEDDFPTEYRPIIRRLKEAQESPEIRDIMQVEDDFINEISDFENKLLESNAREEKAIALAAEERRQKEEERRLKEESNAREEKERNRRIAMEELYVKNLYENGKGINEISILLEISIEVVNEILGKR